MKKVIKNMAFILIAAFAFGCAETETVIIKGVKGDPGINGVSCTVVGTVISCTDGTSLDLKDLGCTIEETEVGVAVTCNGETVEIRHGENGADGQNGTDGTNGVDGQNGTNGTDGQDGVDGQDGTNGTDGCSAGIKGFTAIDMPKYGACYSLGNGLWAENEGGDKADLYNNKQCSHGPGAKKVICDNMHSSDDDFGAGELCVISELESVFILEGSGSSMQMIILDFTLTGSCQESEGQGSGCNNGNGNGSEGCSPSDNGNNDE